MRQVPKHFTALDFQQKKQRSEKISMLTCYDYPSARLVAKSPIDCLLVGDSVSMVVHGYPSTVHASLDMMILHTEAVARGIGSQFLITDLPFLSYHGTIDQTLQNVQRIIQAGAQAVKLEGGDATTVRTITQLVEAGIVVIGHIGFRCQAIHQLGGYRIQGKSAAQAEALQAEAKALEAAGCTALVLECMPASLAKKITNTLTIPTIGIGAGVETDGQVLVWHDMLGMQTEFQPKFIKQFATCHTYITDALHTYHQQVQDKHFPAPEHGYKEA